MSNEIRIRKASRSDSVAALNKAKQFIIGARSEYENQRWSVAGLSAIHGGILAADAVLIFNAGFRSASPNHDDISKLLSGKVPSYKGSAKTQLLGLLKMKNDAAYEQRLLTQSEAVTLLIAAERFLAWAERECK